jgi:hypothetical protein
MIIYFILIFLHGAKLGARGLADKTRLVERIQKNDEPR